MSGLTEEQKRKIEENRKKAIARRIEKQSPQKCNSLLQPSTSNETAAQANVDLGNARNDKNSVVEGTVATRVPTVHFHQDVQPTQPISNNSSNSHFSKYGASCEEISAPPIRPNSGWAFNSGISHNSSDIGETSLMPTNKLKGKCVLVSSDEFAVEVGYNAALIQYFKQMKTRNYDPSTKIWTFKMEEYDTFIKGVHSFRPDIEIEGLPSWIKQMFSSGKINESVIPKANLTLVDGKLVQTLLPFQQESVDLAVHHNGRLLIADDMGLGKTLQAICIACYYRKEWPLLIVSPSSVRYDWAQQICHWLPSVAPCDVNVVDSAKANSTSGMINIISYDLLSKKAKELKQFSRVIIMDESHFLKNSKTVRTKAAMPLIKNAKRVILLSGTPALSRPSELYSQITAVCPDLFKFYEFGARYCNAKMMPWGWDYTGSSNMTELQLLLEKKIMIRRQKKDVLSQLPAKYRQVVMLDPSSVQKNKYLKVASSAMNSSKLKGLSKRGALLEYFHETCKSKLSAVRDYIMDLIEADEKFLVFAHHKEMLDCIEDAIISKASHIQYMRIDGRTTSEQRSLFCNKFQTCESYRVAILSITAANAGLNLSAANIVVFAELFWNPGILVQAEDRAHRIGQQDSVSVQYLVAQHTADDYIWPLVQNKFDTLSKAGLTKDDFSDSDTRRLSDKTSRSLMDMFRSEFIEDSVPVTDISKTTIDINIKLEGISPEKVDVKVTPSSPEKVKISVQSEETRISPRASPHKKLGVADWTRKVATQQKTMNSQSRSLTQIEKTPSKRQASITTFFERTPPKRLCLDVEAIEHSACERMTKNNLFDEKNGATQEPMEEVYEHLFDDMSDWPGCETHLTSTVHISDEQPRIAPLKGITDDKSVIVAVEKDTRSDKSTQVALQKATTGNDRSTELAGPKHTTGSDRSPFTSSLESQRSSSPPIISQEDLFFMKEFNWGGEMEEK